ncbi:MAG: T9SS type A sorting domain-containing protein, partial [Bacteroidia bacterium]
ASQNDTIYYRFTFKSDGINTNKEGWMIDNMSGHMTILHPVKEISQIDNIVVYPNITNGIVNIEMKKKSEKDVIQNLELYNSDGKLVERFGQNYTKLLIDLSNHPTGMYYLNVTINKKVSKFKILYEKN